MQPEASSETTAGSSAKRVAARKRRGVVALLTSATLCAASPAWAEGLVPGRAQGASDGEPVPLASVVDMTALNPCFDRLSLTEAIEQWLERSTVDSRLRIRVSSDDAIPSFSIRSGDGPPLVRTFPRSLGDCDAERDAIALSIALAIDSLSPEVLPVPPSPRWNLEVSAALTTPWAHRTNWGAALSVRGPTGWRVEPELGALLVLSEDQPLPAGPATRLDTRLMLARAGGCFSTPLTPAVLALGCAGVALGPSRVSASGLVDSRTETHWFAAAAGTLELQLRFSRHLGLHVAADVLVSVRRGTLRVDDAGGSPVYVEGLPPALGVFRVGPSAFF